MEKNIIINKGVGPNKSVGWKFSKTPINMQLGCLLENLSKLLNQVRKNSAKVGNLKLRILNLE